MATATPVKPEILRTLPSDAVRQIQWRFADRYDLQCWCSPRDPWPWSGGPPGGKRRSQLARVDARQGRVA